MPRDTSVPPVPPPADWGRWADGRWHQLTPGTDHSGGRRAAIKAARMWARRHGTTIDVMTPTQRGAPDTEPWSIRLAPLETERASALPGGVDPRPLGRTRPAPVFLAERGANIDGLTDDQLAAEAYRLHCRAVDWTTIAVELGYRTVAGAQRAAADHVATMGAPDRAVSTAAMIDQLDRALYRSLEVLDADHVKLYKGRVVTVPQDPNEPDGDVVPLLDSGPTLAAASTIKALLSTKAELLGLNAPTQHEHTLVPLPPVVATWVESKRIDRPEEN